MYTGSVLVRVSNGQTLRIPVFASVALHDASTARANPPGPQATLSRGDVYAKVDTAWPYVPGSGVTGAGSDWLVYPVELGAGLTEARFTVWDAAAGDETYDLYVYDADFDLLASTHPFAGPGVTDLVANSARGPTPAAAPQVLTLASPAQGTLLRRRQPREGERAPWHRRLRRVQLLDAATRSRRRNAPGIGAVRPPTAAGRPACRRSSSRRRPRSRRGR